MNKLYDIISSQFFTFTISLTIFIVAAAFGWERLQYGFNFIDEGYHMTEAWRLTVGSIFSSIGTLTVLDSSMPIVAAMSVFVLSHKRIDAKPYLVKLMTLIISSAFLLQHSMV
jgi:hypothetical protein